MFLVQGLCPPYKNAENVIDVPCKPSVQKDLTKHNVTKHDDRHANLDADFKPRLYKIAPRFYKSESDSNSSFELLEEEREIPYVMSPTQNFKFIDAKWHQLDQDRYLTKLTKKLFVPHKLFDYRDKIS